MASYIITGACALVLSSDNIEKSLEFCIHNALEVDEKPEELTTEAMINGIKFFSKYFKNNPEVSFDAEYFGGTEKLETEILRQQLALTTKLKKENLQHPLALAEKAEKPEKAAVLSM